MKRGNLPVRVRARAELSARTLRLLHKGSDASQFTLSFIVHVVNGKPLLKGLRSDVHALCSRVTDPAALPKKYAWY